jgi:hypothetical protein
MAGPPPGDSDVTARGRISHSGREPAIDAAELYHLTGCSLCGAPFARNIPHGLSLSRFKPPLPLVL